MKSIAILATALFLASAPSPDSEIISEMSAGFLSVANVQPLLAAEPEKADDQTRVAAEQSTDQAPGQSGLQADK